ncbi:uncharacterized protein DUF4244 [Serinibacter salmoneus]|uniref:Uncharacterized protein DUF4244 n=1 Tax=Serinibacter salmoneus TaxID=556530 RepID=A0A2A9D1X5_9MICO|nr:uncharacterized protein DUF4244 [Serinibacter salmoneus]
MPGTASSSESQRAALLVNLVAPCGRRVRLIPITAAAVAFAGLLLVIMRSDEVRGMLMGIIREALSR